LKKASTPILMVKVEPYFFIVKKKRENMADGGCVDLWAINAVIRFFTTGYDY